MYRGLTAKNSRLCRVQPPGAAPETSSCGVSSVFPIPPQPAQRAADKERRFRARAASGPRLPFCSRDGFDSAQPIVGPQGAGMRSPAGALAPRRAVSERQGGKLSPPTCLDGPTLDAPECKADRDPRSKRADAEPKPRASFGIPVGGAKAAFWPSPHPRIRWTVASPGPRNARTVTRARRRQEFKNAQQDAYRCHPPGGDPGRRGPRQSRRRV